MSLKLYAQIVSLGFFFIIGLWQVNNPPQPKKQGITFVNRPTSAPTPTSTPCLVEEMKGDVNQQALYQHLQDDFDFRPNPPIQARMIVQQDLVTGETRYQIMSIVDETLTLESGVFNPSTSDLRGIAGVH